MIPPSPPKPPLWIRPCMQHGTTRRSSASLVQMESFPILTCGRSEKMVCTCILRGKRKLGRLDEEILRAVLSVSKVQHIRKQVINFAQGEEEGIDQACDRFNGLIEQGPKLGLNKRLTTYLGPRAVVDAAADGGGSEAHPRPTRGC